MQLGRSRGREHCQLLLDIVTDGHKGGSDRERAANSPLGRTRDDTLALAAAAADSTFAIKALALISKSLLEAHLPSPCLYNHHRV